MKKPLNELVSTARCDGPCRALEPQNPPVHPETRGASYQRRQEKIGLLRQAPDALCAGEFRGDFFQQALLWRRRSLCQEPEGGREGRATCVVTVGTKYHCQRCRQCPSWRFGGLDPALQSVQTHLGGRLRGMSSPHCRRISQRGVKVRAPFAERVFFLPSDLDLVFVVSSSSSSSTGKTWMGPYHQHVCSSSELFTSPRYQPMIPRSTYCLIPSRMLQSGGRRVVPGFEFGSDCRGGHGKCDDPEFFIRHGGAAVGKGVRGGLGNQVLRVSCVYLWCVFWTVLKLERATSSWWRATVFVMLSRLAPRAAICTFVCWPLGQNQFQAAA